MTRMMGMRCKTRTQHRRTSTTTRNIISISRQPSTQHSHLGIFPSEYQATLFSWPRREPDRHEPPGSFGHVSHVGLSKGPMNHPKNSNTRLKITKLFEGAETKARCSISPEGLAGAYHNRRRVCSGDLFAGSTSALNRSKISIVASC